MYVHIAQASQPIQVSLKALESEASLQDPQDEATDQHLRKHKHHSPEPNNPDLFGSNTSY